jgi:TRAP-type C4-dicarboxylate transport system substrate-binding protein
MRRGMALVVVFAGLLCLVPGSTRIARADAESEAETVLKFAVIIPRTPEGTIEVKKINLRLAELTQGKVQVRVYWGGVAGDDKDVLRKMRMGQIDGTAIGLDVLSGVVRECLVLMTPGLFVNYQQLDAVKDALAPEFNEEAYKNGFVPLVWGDVGQLRVFSKVNINKIASFRTARPWLYAESQLLKEFYKQIGATGVPLGIAEVYGAMQTGMIDTYWATAILAAALRWHSTSTHVSQGLGFIAGAIVYRRGAWDPLPESAKQAMKDLVKERAKTGQDDIRKADGKAYTKLLERGHKAIVFENEGEWWEAGKALRRKMIGRIYTKELVGRAETIAKKFATKEQLAHWGT